MEDHPGDARQAGLSGARRLRDFTDVELRTRSRAIVMSQNVRLITVRIADCCTIEACIAPATCRRPCCPSQGVSSLDLAAGDRRAAFFFAARLGWGRVVRAAAMADRQRHPTTVMPRFKRGIQYARCQWVVAEVRHKGLRLLDRPVKPGDDNGGWGDRVIQCAHPHWPPPVFLVTNPRWSFSIR